MMILLLWTLTACVSFASDEENQPVVIVPTNGPQSEAATVLSFGAPEQQRDVFAPLIEAFNAQQLDSKVVFVATDATPQSAASPSEQLAALARAADTVRITTSEDIADFQRLFVDVAPFIQGNPAFNSNNFLTGTFTNINEPQYFIPYAVNVPIVAYNKDLWTSRGLALPSPDWTWYDMSSAALYIARRDSKATGTFGMIDQGDGTLALIGIAAQANPNLLTSPPEKLDLSSFLPSIYSVEDYADRGGIYFSKQDDLDVRAMPNLIRPGKVVLWPAGYTLSGTNLPFQVGYALYPHMPLPFASQKVGYAISKGSLHPQEAWRWLTFLSQQTVPLPTFTDGTVAVPARTSVAERTRFWQQIGSEAEQAIRQTLARPPLPRSLLSVSVPWLQQIMIEKNFNRLVWPEAVQTVQQRYEQSLLATSSKPTNNAVAPVEPTQQGATDIRFLVTSGDWRLIKQIASTFEQRTPQIQIEIVAPNEGAALPSLETAAQTSDCFLAQAQPIGTGAASLLDLQPLINADKQIPPNDFFPVLQQWMLYNGKQLGLPYRMNFWVLAYNKALFDRAKIGYPNKDWSFTNILDAARSLTIDKASQKQYGFSVQSGKMSSVVLALDRANTNAVTLRDGVPEPAYTNVAVVTALQQYVTLLRETAPLQPSGSVAGNVPYVDTTPQIIAEGRLGMWIDRTMQRPVLGAEAAQANIQYAPLPIGDGPMPQNVVGLDGLYISARTQQVDACWQWIRYLSADISGFAGMFPARQSLSESSLVLRQLPAGAEKVYTAYRDALQKPATPSTNSLLLNPIKGFDSFWFFQAIEQGLQGSNLESELNKAQKFTTEFLDCTRGGTDGPTCAKQVDPTYNGWKNAAQ